MVGNLVICNVLKLIDQWAYGLMRVDKAVRPSGLVTLLVMGAFCKLVDETYVICPLQPTRYLSQSRGYFR